MNMKRKIQQMARNAKRGGWSRERAERGAPPKDHPLHRVFMDEFDRFRPRGSCHTTTVKNPETNARKKGGSKMTEAQLFVRAQLK